ncbi:MAG: glycosyltransferase family 1 protein, partial [Alphaproteobacteria bacterium]|nr:glycosyltransferase family 1 protein [Alphaproteobacteria bacterium]
TLPCPGYPEIRLALRPRRLIRRIMAEGPFDAIHIATEGTLGWSARRYCLKRNLPFTTAFHTRFPEYVSARFFVPVSWGYWVIRRFHKPAVRTMAATDTLRKELEDRGFGETALFSRGVKTELFRPQDKGKLGWKRPVHLYVGRIAIEKNLEAFLSLPLEGSKVLVGEGPQVEELKKAYPDAIFPGPKRGEELAAHFAEADVFVFPSKTDTFGLVMIEALACGVPVAAFPVPGPLDVIGARACREAPGATDAVGCLSEDLEQAIDCALKIDPKQCRDFALGFTWESCARQFASNLEPIHPEEPLARAS